MMTKYEIIVRSNYEGQVFVTRTSERPGSDSSLDRNRQIHRTRGSAEDVS
jgi:hypothetical protein